jgi:ABC-type bacteriocin/lantibiotic exporter with double-glycine peptidase domain
MINIFNLLNPRYKIDFTFILIFIIILAILELLTFSLLQIILVFFSNPENNLKNSFIFSNFFFKFDNLKSILIFFFFIFFSRCVFYIFVSFKRNKLIKNVFDDLSIRLYKNYLNKDYEFFLNKNSSEFISGIVTEVQKYSYKVLENFIYLIAELFLISTILFFFLFNYFIPTIIFFLITTIFFFSFFKYFKKIFKILGHKQTVSDEKKINDLQKSFYVIQNIKLDNLEDFFSKRFEKNNKISSHAQFFITFINEIPKPIVEIIALIIVFLILLIFYYFLALSKTEVFTMLGMFMVAMFRLLPSYNRIINSINNIRFHYSSINFLSDKFKNIPQDNASYSDNIYSTLKFEKYIILKNVFFCFNSSLNHQLKNINLIINKNTTICISGESGAGKTTLLNIICGLLIPTSGEIFIDNQPLKDVKKIFQKKIGYVAQKTFLSDESIIQNIIFGKDPNFFDHNLFNQCIKDSNLKDFIDRLPNGKNTIVGEMGSKLSGGQQQRIGIARALYKKPEILILDEATSALDDNAENEIINTINNLKNKVTIIIVSHQKKLLDCSDFRYIISKNTLIKI